MADNLTRVGRRAEGDVEEGVGLSMTTPDRKPTAAELSAELERLQAKGDEIRARMKATMAELENNAVELKEAVGRAAGTEPWRPT